MLDGQGVEFIGEINDAQKNEFLGEALALLFPIDWPEPFGLVMIEAMASGTPVLAFGNGSVSEIIDQGVSRHIVDTTEQAVSAVTLATGRISPLSASALGPLRVKNRRIKVSKYLPLRPHKQTLLPADHSVRLGPISEVTIAMEKHPA
jgi:glycosyltransferase involved in cell wall biosynthesis